MLNFLYRGNELPNGDNLNDVVYVDRRPAPAVDAPAAAAIPVAALAVGGRGRGVGNNARRKRAERALEVMDDLHNPTLRKKFRMCLDLVYRRCRTRQMRKLLVVPQSYL